MIDLSTLPQEVASLVQVGLKELGHYQGTTRGIPGPKTEEAFQDYLSSLVAGGADLFAENFASVAEGQVGVREEGHNGGEDVRKFQRATWLDPGAWPWCAAFVCWCYQQASKQASAPSIKRPRTAGAWDFERWAKDQGVTLFKPSVKAKRGDIVIFTFSHIGIAVADQDGEVVSTVEGNTNPGGSREGDGVYKKTRKASKIRSLIRF